MHSTRKLIEDDESALYQCPFCNNDTFWITKYFRFQCSECKEIFYHGDYYEI